MAEAPRCVVVGGGGHARVVIDSLRLARAATPVGVLDQDRSRHGARHDDVEILGGDDRLEALVAYGITHFAMGLGAIEDNRPRAALFERALQAGLQPLTIVHPSAVLSSSARLGSGTFVGPRAVVNAGAVIGINVIVNTSVVVEHDCVVGDHVHLASASCLAGGARVDEFALVGAGALVLQKVRVGSRSVVGAGAVVIGDVEEGARVAGVPARSIAAESGT